MVAECLEVRARLRVRRRKLGVFAAVGGVGEVLEEMEGVRGEDRGEGEGGFVGVSCGESLVGGECESG